MSFQGYTERSRDGNRLSTMKNIETWVDIFLTKSGKIPIPDVAQSFTGGSASNPIKIQQWIVWSQMIQAINMNQIPLAPLTQEKYHYSVFWDGIYYQIGTEKENSDLWYISKTFADIKTTMIAGNYRMDPSLPSLFVVNNTVWTGGIFDPSVCFVVDGWENTFASNSWSCMKKSDMLASGLDMSLVGYWDMETLTSDGKLKDLSGNGNDGTLSWTTTWKSNNWQWQLLNDQKDYIDVGKINISLSENTFSLLFQEKKYFCQWYACII